MEVVVVGLHHQPEGAPGEDLQTELLAVRADQPASLERGEAAGPEPGVRLSPHPANIQPAPATVTNNLHLPP